MHDKWRNIVQCFKEKGKAVEFTKLVEFVKNEAKKVIDPIYGKQAMSRPSKFIGLRENRANGTFSTNIKPKNNEQTLTQSCLYCLKTNHVFNDCTKLIEQPWQSRVDWIKKKGCCFGCLRIGHMKKVCKIKLTCSTCPGKHPTVLHNIEFNIDKDVPVPDPDVTNEKTLSSMTTAVNSNSVLNNDSKQEECTMAIIQAVFSTGRDIETITHLEVKCLLFLQGSETNYPPISCLC